MIHRMDETRLAYAGVAIFPPLAENFVTVHGGAENGRGIAIHAAACLGRRGDWRSRYTDKTRARRDVRGKHPVREWLQNFFGPSSGDMQEQGFV